MRVGGDEVTDAFEIENLEDGASADQASAALLVHG